MKDWNGKAVEDCTFRFQPHDVMAQLKRGIRSVTKTVCW